MLIDVVLFQIILFVMGKSFQSCDDQDRQSVTRADAPDLLSAGRA